VIIKETCNEGIETLHKAQEALGGGESRPVLLSAKEEEEIKGFTFVSSRQKGGGLGKPGCFCI